jgi:hypothetical protein
MAFQPGCFYTVPAKIFVRAVPGGRKIEEKLEGLKDKMAGETSSHSRDKIDYISFLVSLRQFILDTQPFLSYSPDTVSAYPLVCTGHLFI